MTEEQKQLNEDLFKLTGFYQFPKSLLATI